MKTTAFVLAIILSSFFLTIIHANEGKKYSTYVSQDQLLDSLIEIKWRELLLSKYKESIARSQKNKINRPKQDSVEESHERTFVRRKLVGISDNPF
ncbi:unnamed protein product [Adineta steineri]|uniref:Uncharacterized protein n=1 Tax=Adineta steineri TaxID=433720 RepID=A0A815HIT3_9BILA|nr:unnamed protein product [Adineta steineri]CAF3656635.1 unnamed protein product [Adineta steineri]